jgi:hypothetical protein
MVIVDKTLDVDDETARFGAHARAALTAREEIERAMVRHARELALQRRVIDCKLRPRPRRNLRRVVRHMQHDPWRQLRRRR